MKVTDKIKTGKVYGRVTWKYYVGYRLRELHILGRGWSPEVFEQRSDMIKTKLNDE